MYNEPMRTMRPVHDEQLLGRVYGDIIGAKWTAVIVHDLSEGPRRFSELERSCPGISPRTLSERLRVLEQEGIIERTSARRRVDYALTEKGEALLPIIDAMRAVRARVARPRARARARRLRPARRLASGRVFEARRASRARGDAERDVARRGSRSFGECMLAPGRAKPVRIVGMPLSASAGTIGSVPPLRRSSGRGRARARRRPGRAAPPVRRGMRPAGARTSARSRVGASGRGVAQQPLERRAISSTSWPGASRIETFASASTGSTVFCSAARRRDAVHVDRRAGQRAEVELLGRRSSIGARPPRRARSPPGRARPRTRAPRRSGRDAGAQLVRDARRRPRESHERVHGVQGGAAEDPRVEVALAASAGARGSR